MRSTKYCVRKYSMGADNPVIMSETQQVELFRNFKNLARYPFDEEECTITIAMNEPITNSIRLIARIEDKGPKMFSQYYIENWTITCEDKASKFMRQPAGLGPREARQRTPPVQQRLL